MSDIGGFSLSEMLTKGVDEVDQSICFEHSRDEHICYLNKKIRSKMFVSVKRSLETVEEAL